MLNKVWGLARLLALLVAVVTAFVAIPNVDVGLVLVVLGILAGIGYSEDNVTRLFLTVLVLPAVGGALGMVPAVGTQLSAIAGNIALAAAGAATSVIAIRLFNLAMGDLKGLGGGSAS